jgi:hypothetical protein
MNKWACQSVKLSSTIGLTHRAVTRISVRASNRIIPWWCISTPSILVLIGCGRYAIVRTQLASMLTESVSRLATPRPMGPIASSDAFAIFPIRGSLCDATSRKTNKSLASGWPRMIRVVHPTPNLIGFLYQTKLEKAHNIGHREFTHWYQAADTENL